MAQMTEISRQMLHSAFKVRTTAEAIAILKENAHFRTLRDVLLAADPEHAPEEMLKKRLVSALRANHPETKPDSPRRSVDNWFNGSVRTVGRDTAFELCLILGLSLEEANRLVMRITEEAIHWRNPKEIAWSYAIAHKLSYPETLRLAEAAQDAWQKSEKKDADSDVFTHLVRGEVLQHLRGSQKELLAYLAENAGKWDAFHNTAYDLFLKYMQYLKLGALSEAEFEERKKQYKKEKKEFRDHPEVEIETDDELSVKRILDAHFFRKCIRNSGRMSALQKSIRLNWPDQSILSKMKTRADNTDVSRKVLIMLFLATNGDASEFQMDEEEEDETRTRDRAFRDLYTRLNHMLSRCGFQLLDPRNPFDWMILFCICAGDNWETDRRLESVLDGLFGNEGGNETKTE